MVQDLHGEDVAGGLQGAEVFEVVEDVEYLAALVGAARDQQRGHICLEAVDAVVDLLPEEDFVGAHVEDADLAVLEPGSHDDVGVQVVGKEPDAGDLALVGLLAVDHLAGVQVGEGDVALPVAGGDQRVPPLELRDGLRVELQRVEQLDRVQVPDHERVVVAGRNAQSVLVGLYLRDRALVRLDRVAPHARLVPQAQFAVHARAQKPKYSIDLPSFRYDSPVTHSE